MMFIVFSWSPNGTVLVEGVFSDEQEARDVAVIQKRAVSVRPIEPDTILEDRDNWPGAYYVYPDGSTYHDDRADTNDTTREGAQASEEA